MRRSTFIRRLAAGVAAAPMVLDSLLWRGPEVALDDESWMPPMGEAMYAVLHNDTTGDVLFAWELDATVVNGEELTLTVGSDGVLHVV